MDEKNLNEMNFTPDAEEKDVPCEKAEPDYDNPQAAQAPDSIREPAEYVSDISSAFTPDAPSPLSTNEQSNPAPSPEYIQKTERTSVSYTPVSKPVKKTDKNKKTKYARLSSVIAVCLVAVILCGCAGFGGTLLANRMAPASSIKANNLSEPLVIYRDVSVSNNTSPDGTSSMTYAQVASMVKDSVVEINTEYTTRSPWFQYVSGGAGSGVIISEDGCIVTNAHVVMNNDSSALADSITVRLSNGTEYDAVCIGYDTEADIAIVKIEADGLIPAVCGNSDALSIGEELIVVGNPLGELGGTVTNGIISATEREIEVSGNTMTLIQTNAAINPGNSGGGMFDMNGRLVGIVNAKSSGTDIEGLGFAIPVNNVLSVTEQLIQYGYVRGKITIGAEFRDVSSGSMSYYYNVKPGIYVESLVEGLNDDVLQIGDRIIAVDGDEVSSASEINAKISECSVGDTLKFQLYRSRKLIEVTVTCYEKTPDNSNISFEDHDTNTWSPNGGYNFFPFDLDDFFGGFFEGF